jgi:hypothetical protein
MARAFRCSVSFASASRKRVEGEGGRTVARSSEGLQGSSGVVDLGGGEGEMRGCVGQRGARGEGGGVGDGLLEQRLGGAGAVQAEEGFGAVVEQRWIGVRALRCDERGVERVGLVGVVRVDVDAGEQAGDVGVLGIGGVQFFQQRRGECVLGGIAGGKVGAGDAER